MINAIPFIVTLGAAFAPLIQKEDHNGKPVIRAYSMPTIKKDVTIFATHRDAAREIAKRDNPSLEVVGVTSGDYENATMPAWWNAMDSQEPSDADLTEEVALA